MTDDFHPVVFIGEGSDGELWDLFRPLTGDCHLNLLKYEDAEAKTVLKRILFERFTILKTDKRSY
jgi:hypothetical protein